MKKTAIFGLSFWMANLLGWFCTLAIFPAQDSGSYLGEWLGYQPHWTLQIVLLFVALFGQLITFPISFLSLSLTSSDMSWTVKFWSGYGAFSFLFSILQGWILKRILNWIGPWSKVSA